MDSEREVAGWHVDSVHMNLSAMSVNLLNLTAINAKQGFNLGEAENKIDDWR